MNATPPPPSPGDLAVEMVRSFVGCSLSARRDELAALVCFPGDEPAVDVTIRTNCAMFALGIWRALGCKHPLLLGKYKIGMAMWWADVIARAAGASYSRKAYPSAQPYPGDVMHYCGAPGTDHLEFCLTWPNPYLIDHAGAGRANNAVTESAAPSDYRSNAGRPLVAIYRTSEICRA